MGSVAVDKLARPINIMCCHFEKEYIIDNRNKNIHFTSNSVYYTFEEENIIIDNRNKNVYRLKVRPSDSAEIYMVV